MPEEGLYELPSYHDAKQQDPWPHILPYLQRRDLLSLCRVSRRLRGRVQGHMWRNPRNFFPNDEVDALNAFVYLSGAIRLLNGAEPASYIRTIDMLNLGNDNFYIDVSGDWLDILVSHLPKLRSLRLANSPMLDSKAINCLQHVQHDNIRFVDVSNCANATSERLSSMIALLPQLYFLDLSGHWGLRAAGVLDNIRGLACLKILRLRKCNLNDSDMSDLFGHSNDSSVRSVASIQSLDLSSNNLTDKCIRLISTMISNSKLSDNIVPPSYSETIYPASRASELEDPVYCLFKEKLKCLDAEMGEQLVFKDDPAKVISYLENPNLPNPAVCYSQLTHLYISGNKITLAGLQELLTLHQLEALDCGSFKLGDDGSLISGEKDNVLNLRLLHQGFDKFNKLQYLRISHRVVTGCQTHSDGSDEVANRNDTGNTDDSLFPLGLYCIDRLVLTQIPKNPIEGNIYSQLQRFQASYNDMQKKWFEYRHRLPRNVYEFPVRDLFARHSPLTKELFFETIKEQEPYNEDDVLDIPALDITYDDFSFFPDDKTSRNSMKGTDHCSSEKNKDNVGEESLKRQLTLADLAKNISSGSKPSSLDNVVWHGKVKLVDGGLG